MSTILHQPIILLISWILIRNISGELREEKMILKENGQLRADLPP